MGREMRLRKKKKRKEEVRQKKNHRVMQRRRRAWVKGNMKVTARYDIEICNKT